MSDDRKKRAARAEQMRKERERAERRQRNVVTAGIVVVVLVLVAVAGVAINNANKNNTSATGPQKTPANITSTRGITYDQQGATGKSTNAKPVKVVLYEDFQCPYCQQFEAAEGADIVNAVKAGEITVEYRMLSFLDSSTTDDYSSRALSASMCVYEADGIKAWKAYHDVLYENQPEETQSGGLSETKLIALAKEAGSSSTALSKCIRSNPYQKWAQANQTTAFKTKDSTGSVVSGTPTVWVDGAVVSGSGGAGTIPAWTDIKAAITKAAATS